MFYINSPLSQFEVSNLIGIFTPILDQLNFIPYNLALYSDIFENFSYLTKPEFWGSIMGYIVNNLFIGVFFEDHINNLTVFLTEFTVRFSIFGCIFEQLYSLTVYTGCVAQSVFSFYDYCTGILMDFSLMDYSLMGCSIVVLCGISIIVVSFIYHYTKDIFINLPIFTFFGFSFFVVSYIVLYIGCIGSNFINSCGISTIVGYIILYSGAGRKIIDEIRKNAGNIGTGAVGLATGLDAVLNLADRFKGDKGDKGGGSSGSGSGESDSGGSGDSGSDKNNESDKKDNNTKDTDKKENTDSTENKTANNKN